MKIGDAHCFVKQKHIVQVVGSGRKPVGTKQNENDDSAHFASSIMMGDCFS